MKHRRTQRTLGRAPAHRQALLRNMGTSLLEHGHITTTETKAKELKQWFEPLVTVAKRDDSLNTRRTLMARLGQKADLARLQDVAKTAQKRTGGYVRLTRMPGHRHDGARLVRVDILSAETTK